MEKREKQKLNRLLSRNIITVINTFIFRVKRKHIEIRLIISFLFS